MHKWLYVVVAVVLLASAGGLFAEEQEDPGKVTDVTLVSAYTAEAMWVSRYSLMDMKFKPAMLGLNLIPARTKYVDMITLIGTEDITTQDKISHVRVQVGLGARTNFEALDFSDDVANWLQSRLGIILPEGLSLGPNLNPYGVIDPIETGQRIINVVQGSTFKKEFNREFWDIYSDAGIMTEFIKYTIKF